MSIIFNYRFNNKNRGEIKPLLIIIKSGKKQDEQHKIKSLS